MTSIYCLHKNLITQVVWYLHNEKKNDIETLSIDTVLNEEHLEIRKKYRKNGKTMQKMCNIS